MICGTAHMSSMKKNTSLSTQLTLTVKEHFKDRVISGQGKKPLGFDQIKSN